MNVLKCSSSSNSSSSSSNSSSGSSSSSSSSSSIDNVSSDKENETIFTIAIWQRIKRCDDKRSVMLLLRK